MSTFQCIAGTDAASIGLWDRKWSDPSIREKSISKFLRRLPVDAEQRRLFFIETGGDGQSSVEIHIDNQYVPDNRYRKISSGFTIDIESGEAILDGLESYGSKYTDTNIFTIDNGRYSIELFELNDPEIEEYSIVQTGPSRKPHIIEKLTIPAFLILCISIFLFFQKSYLIASILFLISLAYSTLLGHIQKQLKLKDQVKYKTDVKVPYLILYLSKCQPAADQKGGYISLV
jgi:hypothetical protein